MEKQEDNVENWSSKYLMKINVDFFLKRDDILYFLKS